MADAIDLQVAADRVLVSPDNHDSELNRNQRRVLVLSGRGARLLAVDQAPLESLLKTEVS
jgi:hypothetical protein